MNARHIRTKLRALRRKRAAVLLAGLTEQLRQHGNTGELPPDAMSRTFVELSRTAQTAMDLSIGGGPGHDQACRDFEAAYERWQEVLRT